MRQKRAIIFEKLQNFIQNENNSHLVTYESAGFGGFYIKNRFFFQEEFLDINNFDSSLVNWAWEPGYRAV